MTLIAIIGAGPAGLAAAQSALEHDAEVVLIDLNDRPGGQYQRELPEAYHSTHPEAVQHEWKNFSRRRDAVLGHQNCRWMANTVVYLVERQAGAAPTLHLITGEIDGHDRTRTAVHPDAVVIATGAHDRVVPFPGWTLPGVYTAGAAQTLARTERVALGRRAVVSGTGPFLLPVATSLSQVGTEVTAVLEANRPATLARGWMARPWELLAQSGKTGDLVHYAGHLARHRIPLRTGRAVIAALGDDRVEAAVVARLDSNWSPIAGTETTVELDTICVGHGFTPALEIARAAGCEFETTSAGVFVRTDEHQETSAPHVFAAGEITGIGGAQAAAVEGQIAGLAAAGVATAITPALGRKRRASRQFVQRLATAHPLRDGWHQWLRSDTVVCRCESTTLGDLCAQHSAGNSLRATKLNTRAGLGPCQGRFCGDNVAGLCASRPADNDLTDVMGLAGAHRQNRPMAQPVRLGEIAAAENGGHR